MGILIILIIVSLMVAGLFLAAFLWAINSGQMDDTDTPARRILTDDTKAKRTSNNPE